MATSQLSVIKRFMRSLDTTSLSGTKALDKAVKYASNGYFSNITAAINKMISDCKSLGATNFLLKKCGIILDNDDTGAITGSDAGGKTTKTKDSIVPESGSLDTSFTGTSFTTNGLTFRLAKTTSLTKNEKIIWQALKTWWAEETLNLIKESYGYSFADDDATVKEINVVFENKSNAGYLAYSDYPKKVNGRYMLTLTINRAYFSNIKSTDVNGISNKKGYLDRTISHELTHSIMMAKVDNFKSLPLFIKEGLAELTHGIDDLRTDAIETLAENPAKLEKILSLTTNSNSAYTYAGGYMFLRYLAKQVADPNSRITTDNSKNVTVKNSVLTVSKKYSDTTLDLSKYSSSVKKVVATSLSNGIEIIGNKNPNTIAAGKGNDTIYGGAGNDSLVGNAGNDKIFGEVGSDIILGGAGNDSLSGDAGNDKLYGGAGLDTIYGGVGNDSLNGEAGNDKLYGDAGTDIIYGDAGNDTLSGDAGNDKLYGGAGNDSLWGGKGNDTLYGDAGADTFIYESGDGRDVIYGFENNDMLQITGAFSASYNKSKNELAFKVGSTQKAITLKDFTATSFRINNSSYKINGTTLEGK